MSNSIVFIGGIHGVGKTSISLRLAALLSASHITASDLIRGVVGETRMLIGMSHDKAVANVDANQAALLRGLNSYRERSGSGPILLDGHFSLLKTDGTVTEIPVAVFQMIAPAAVLLVEARDHVISERLMKRDGVSMPISTISNLAERERACAEVVCSTLGIPMWAIRGDSETEEAATSAASHLRDVLPGAA
jgi:adenylate kinase